MAAKVSRSPSEPSCTIRSLSTRSSLLEESMEKVGAGTLRAHHQGIVVDCCDPDRPSSWWPSAAAERQAADMDHVIPLDGAMVNWGSAAGGDHRLVAARIGDDRGRAGHGQTVRHRIPGGRAASADQAGKLGASRVSGVKPRIGLAPFSVVPLIGTKLPPLILRVLAIPPNAAVNSEVCPLVSAVAAIEKVPISRTSALVAPVKTPAAWIGARSRADWIRHRRPTTPCQDCSRALRPSWRPPRASSSSWQERPIEIRAGWGCRRRPPG